MPPFARSFAFRVGGVALIVLILGLFLFVKLAGALIGATVAVLSNPRALALLLGAFLVFLLLRRNNPRR
ncbi:hypothetical protein CVU37_12490 [candidate division BRC1 bacterium HGW-BRC1-1]|jgi:succinate dehydrogenase hydrophobic anchor subunit|nr:MAG: hypothetical protein CVU37_12490 [candidate division BRC1 bacterium HGW-BRC1-1]